MACPQGTKHHFVTTQIQPVDMGCYLKCFI